LSCMHSDFDRARQLSHYWRRRGAQTVLGGSLASLYPQLCAPWFDAVVVGDPEDTVPRVFDDACAGRLAPLYRSAGYDAARVPTPRLAAHAARALVPLALEATRGCPFACDFCALTGLGTRHGCRDPQALVRDLRSMQHSLRRRRPWWQLHKAYQGRTAIFTDNNIAGNLAWLRAFCDAVQPLGLIWASSATFNLLGHPQLLARMHAAGCRALFVGLESFNPASIADFNKPQNRLSQVRRNIDNARDAGILVVAGMMLSPLHDTVAYIRSLPERLDEAGLHVPAFVCFETPLPGTPFFARLARSATPALLPNALLRDFNGYTLTVAPRSARLDEFVAAYRDTVTQLYSARRRWAKLGHDLPRLLGARSWGAALVDIGDMLCAGMPRAHGRSLVAGTDLAPPERVPFERSDFDSEAQRLEVLSPSLVSDEDGRVLDAWRSDNLARVNATLRQR
jgi:Radical SAM superfamily